MLGVFMMALVGCGNGYGPYPATALEANERVLRVRGAFEKAKSDPLANEVRLDLQRAESWIVTAEADAKRGKPDERADLYLSTAEGQLSMIQTHYARRRAEDKLAKRREQALASPEETTGGGGTP
ncbi:hypothetical protein [Polyangium aurulentum]|uniref:hypothetical protein n=1 Tax=Polyangium aurulentum TaxID=2567896 RepID=UPI00200BC2C2|nr:hypothetical protein [Polyangium aurulentum]UQA57958.1 hypothetical protein E8A73_042935 [Polyangium aurulentum]